MSEATQSSSAVSVKQPVNWARRLAALTPKQRELAELRLREQGVDLSTIEILPRATGEMILPLSFAQQRLWFLHQLEPGSVAYNISGAMQLDGELNVAALHRAFVELVRRHEALRSTFDNRRGEPRQVVHSVMDLRQPVVDLSGLAEPLRVSLSRHLVTMHTQRPFDLSTGPLVRIALFRLTRREHCLAQSIHHVVSDAWSMEIIRRELLVLYRDLAASSCRERPTTLAPVRLQYGDFAVWQRKWLQGKVLADQLSYWKEQLGDGVPALELQADHKRAAESSLRGDECSLSVEEEAASALDRMARQEKTTQFVVFCTLFEALLWRLSGKTEFTIGSTIAGRNRPEVEEIVGFFINTRVLRADFSGQPTFREAVRRVRTVVLGAEANQDLPFEKLVEELAPQRSLQRSPFFQVTFSLVQAGTVRTGEALASPGQSELEVSTFGSETRELPFDLTLRVEPRLRGASVTLEYRRDLFERTRMVRLLGEYGRLLDAASADPDLSLGAISLLDAAQHQQILVEWSAAEADRSSAATGYTVHGLIAEQVRKTPTAVAVRYEDQTLTYGQLEARTNRLARHLRRLGVGDDDLVGLSMERSLDLVIAVVAILKAGAGYLPLDPSYPEDRLAFMVEDAEMPVLVTSGDLAAELPKTAARLVRLDVDGAAIAAESSEAFALPGSAESLCYAIFTSGSTGRPKGTLVTHRAVHNRMLWLQESYGLTAEDRVLQKTPISFDVSVWEIFWPLTCGASIVLARPEGHMDAAYLLDLLCETAITTLHFVPSMLRIFLAQPGLERLNTQGKVRRVVASGEALTFDLQQTFFERFGRSIPLHNMYGPSEAARATFHRVDPEEQHSVVPIGRPVVNNRIYLVDSASRPVAIGVPGELLIGGIGVARGYHRRPSLTAEKFLPDPFAAEPGTRLYRTGDLTRYLPNGTIEFLGRIDHQVKVRGMRVELGEIDAALESHSAVRDAVVVVRELAAGDQRLVAYLVAHEEAPAAPELRRYLADRLPDYMLPTSFMVLEAMPLTPSGKVDRKALPSHDDARPELEGAYLAPRTALEESLAGIFAAVLRIDQVGVLDDFFALGGHSLLATQIVSRVRDDLELEVPLRTLFETPTVAGWAETIEAMSRDPKQREIPPLVAVPRVPGKGMALSFAQQRLWFLDRLVPNNPFYNMFTGFRLAGSVHYPILDRVFQEIVRRHEILRTVFVEHGDEPRQVLLSEPFRLPLAWIDLSGLPKQERDEQLGRLANLESQRPFDLAKGPLLRVHALRLGAREWALLINIHHIISDGWSTGIFYRELIGLYRAFAAGEASPFEPLKIQYADFSEWQRGWLKEEVLDDQVAYWAEQLANAPPALSLPTDRRRPEIERFVGGMETFRLAPELVEGLQRVMRERGVTLFMITLAVFNTLLYRYSGQRDILVGSGIANRTLKDLEGLIGFFVNTLVMRTRLSPRGSFSELLARVRDVALAAYSHQDLPFERLVDELNIERNLASNPLCQVGFVVQNYPIRFDSQDLSDVQLSPLGSESVDTGTAKFDLTVYLREANRWITYGIEYSSDLFDRTTARRMGLHFENLVDAMVKDPSRSLLDLPILHAAEHQQLVHELSGRRVEMAGAGLSLHQGVDLWAAERPEAIALCDDSGVHVSYRYLVEESWRLAKRLWHHGVRAGSRVGVCMERSPRMMVAFLATVRLGAAYVPLSPSLPMKRLLFVLGDSRPEVLLIEGEGLQELAVAAMESKTVVLDLAQSVEREESARLDEFKNQMARRGELSPLLPAYVIYTSGSTGSPKGVEVAHSAVVNLTLWMIDEFAVALDDRFLQRFSANFDGSVIEFWTPLLGGAKSVISMSAYEKDPRLLAEEMARQSITLTIMVPPLLRVLLDEPSFLGLRSLRRFFAGGDVLSVEAKERFRAASPAALTNLYGPTEAAVACTFLNCPAGNEPLTVAIGRPIGNAKIVLLDPNLSPTPLGALGELSIGGVCLAQGYLGLPRKTAESFIPDPTANVAGARVYRSGDLARLSSDGLLEFAGRKDLQVKIRGFRIELEEIEAALRTHPAVLDVVVMARQDSDDEDKRLVAYVVQDPDYAGEEAPGEEVDGKLVDEWSNLFDDIYGGDAEVADPTFNTLGWDSNYTAEPLPTEEMREWLDDTLERIASLQPRRVLEIGCGSGMILFGVAPDCEHYLATDLSREGIEALRNSIGERMPQVALAHQPADCFDGIESNSFDTLILNSVVQYFPTADYLAEVIEGALRVMAPGAALFLGDIRCQPLDEIFATDVEMFQAEAQLPLTVLQSRIQRRLAEENELTVSPAFFAALKERLPEIERVEIHPKFAQAHNELTAFRYQVVLRLAGVAEVRRASSATWPATGVQLDGRDEDIDIAYLRRRLTDRPDLLRVTGLANARLATASRTVACLLSNDELATVEDLRRTVENSKPVAVDPADLVALAAEVGYEAELGWPSPEFEGRFDAVLRSGGESDEPPLREWLGEPTPLPGEAPLASYCNRPLQGRFMRRAVPALRSYLGTSLPDYMVPVVFVLMESLPLNTSGKIDRRALPVPEESEVGRQASYVAPRSEVEKRLAQIWCDVLGLDRVGIHDDFFALGGHSLLATRVSSRLRDQFGVDLPLRKLFESPILVDLAEFLEAVEWAREPSAASGASGASDKDDPPPAEEGFEEWEL